MAFLDSLDIANLALQLCGQPQIDDVAEDSKANKETSKAYEQARRPELRRNTWRFAVRNAVLRPVDTDTMLLVPTAYSSTTLYLPGAIVSDANGMLWLSVEHDNLNNTPGQGNNVWDAYFGPLTISPYDSTTSYLLGELVYKPGALAGSYAIYQSLVEGNTDAPDVATAYDPTVTYHGDAVVSYLGSQWRSLIEVNLGITPANGPLAFDVGATYSAAQTVTGSDHFIYSSVGSGNIGHDPTTDGGIHWTNTGVANAWTNSPTIPVSASSWRVIGATMKNLVFSYPIGSGPSSQEETRNVYRLPAGYLKVAPQDPKAGSVGFLGAPSGLMYNDWNFQGNYIVTRDSSPIMFRFTADVTRVVDMDDMFCRGLACSVAAIICEPLTQSTSKLSVIASEYKTFMGEARTTNAIENGPIEPPEDEFITCRI